MSRQWAVTVGIRFRLQNLTECIWLRMVALSSAHVLKGVAGSKSVLSFFLLLQEQY